VGRLDINMATRKKHTPEQVMRKLALAPRDRAEPIHPAAASSRDHAG
jgi:hypothetical protein